MDIKCSECGVFNLADRNNSFDCGECGWTNKPCQICNGDEVITVNPNSPGLGCDPQDDVEVPCPDCCEGEYLKKVRPVEYYGINED